MGDMVLLAEGTVRIEVTRIASAKELKGKVRPRRPALDSLHARAHSLVRNLRVHEAF